MRSIFTLLAVCLLPLVAAPELSAQVAPEDHLAMFTPFIGSWTGAFDGSERTDSIVFELVPGGKAVRHYAADGSREALYIWNESLQQVRFFLFFAGTGQYAEGYVTSDGGDLVFHAVHYNGPASAWTSRYTVPENGMFSTQTRVYSSGSWADGIGIRYMKNND